jgi:hypothetical protein
LLTLADLSEGRADALFGEAGQSFSFSLLTFQALQRGKEPRRFRLAK